MTESYPAVPRRQREVLGAGFSAALTGGTAETALATVVIPGNALGANGQLIITPQWFNNNNGNNKFGRFRLGGTSATTGTIYFSYINTTQTFYMDSPRVIINKSATNSQEGRGTTTTGAGGSGNALVTSAIDTTAAFNLMFTGQLAVGTDNIGLVSYLVEIIYGA